jgi:hypothetical protein
MPDDMKIVAAGLFTEPEFKWWGHRLRHVYLPEGNAEFDDLLKAIDEVEARALFGQSSSASDA